MTKLSDFGGGVEHDPGPEDQVRITLSNWIKRDDVTVYWDREHNYGFSTFTPGQRARPDLLVDGPSKTYAIEVKTGNNSSKIHDALPQLVNYWAAVVDGETDYRVSGKPVEIDAFLLATQHSPAGRLYDAEGESDVLRTGTSEGRQRAVQAGQLPTREFNATERIIRAVWRFSKDRRPDAKLGIGALLSSRLDGDTPGTENSHPMALYKSHGGQQPEGFDSPGYQWWESIPFYLDKNR